MIGGLNCACLEHGPKRPDITAVRDVGQDPTEGRYADVRVIRCTRCGRVWLRYQFEFEAFTASGQWYEAVIDEGTAATITPESAYGFIRAVSWRIVGGSFYGHTGERVDGNAKVTSPAEQSVSGTRRRTFDELAAADPDKFDDFNCRPCPSYACADNEQIVPEHLQAAIEERHSNRMVFFAFLGSDLTLLRGASRTALTEVWDSRALRWRAFIGELPKHTWQVSRAEAWQMIYSDYLGLDFGSPPT